MTRPVTLFTGQWADLHARGARREVRRLGLRRPGAGVLGRPLRRRRGAERRRLLRRPREILERHGLACWAIGNHLVGPGGLRPDRRAPQGRPAGRRVGRRRSRRCPPARGREDEGHGARGGPAGRAGGDRLHRVVHVAHALLVPAERLRRGRARLRGLRGALEPDHRCLRRRGREVRARGASDGDRLRLPDHSQGARRHRQPRGIRHQLRSRVTSSTSSSTPPRSSTSSATASTTRTSRTPSAASTDARRSSAATSNFGEPGRGWDFVSPGHGDVDFEEMFRALNRIGYEGPLSIEWEDSGHGPRLGRSGRAGVRAPHGFLALRGGVRRRVREGGLMPETGS